MAVAVDSDKKAELRQTAKTQLAVFLSNPSLNKAEIDRRISDQISQIISKDTGCGASFKAMPTEPELGDLEHLAGWSWAYPKVIGEQLLFYVPENSSAWATGPFGIREPDPLRAKPTEIHNCRVVCVPGVAFDRQGRRLGRGKGFYDRALANFKGLKIGVGYSVQVLDQPLPADDHDVAMNYVVTENFIMQPKG